MTPALPRQEEPQEKKLKRREKLKRRGKAEGEQAQPEESELGDGELEPPLPKKTKKVKEKSNGSEPTVKPSSAVSDDATSLAAQSTSGDDATAGEQDSDAEVVTLHSRCLA